MRKKHTIHYVGSSNALIKMQEIAGIAEQPCVSGTIKCGALHGSLSLAQCLRIIKIAHQSKGTLRLYMSDGRELNAATITIRQLLEIFPECSNDKLQQAMTQVRVIGKVPLLKTNNLFDYRWALI